MILPQLFVSIADHPNIMTRFAVERLPVVEVRRVARARLIHKMSSGSLVFLGVELGHSLNMVPRAPSRHVADGRHRNSVLSRQLCAGLSLS
jgi:hypothetical protein